MQKDYQKMAAAYEQLSESTVFTATQTPTEVTFQPSNPDTGVDEIEGEVEPEIEGEVDPSLLEHIKAVEEGNDEDGTHFDAMRKVYRQVQAAVRAGSPSPNVLATVAQLKPYFN